MDSGHHIGPCYPAAIAEVDMGFFHWPLSPMPLLGKVVSSRLKTGIIAAGLFTFCK